MTKCDLDISLFPHAANAAAAARKQTGKTAIFESEIGIIFCQTSLIMSRPGKKTPLSFYQHRGMTVLSQLA